MAAADATSYAGRYELMHDLLGGDYQQYLLDFDSEGQQAPATLRDLLLGAGEMAVQLREGRRVTLCDL